MIALALVFLATLALGVPIAFAMGIASAAVIWKEDLADLLVVPQQVFAGLDSFPLLAIPFFILSAELMTGGRLTHTPLRLALARVRRARGGVGPPHIVPLHPFSG